MEMIQMNKMELAKQTLFFFKEKIERESHKLLYASMYGSHLYGTSRPESDIDFKGIFLPSKRSCLLNNPPRVFSFKTGDSSSKNTSEDIDIQFWSLQYWLELVRKGDTNAVDLLYSFTNPQMIVYDSPILGRIFRNHQRLFTAKECKAYIGYAIGQAKKYGVKGSRMGVIKRVLEFFNHHHLDDFETFPDLRLRDIVTSLIDKCGDSSYCFVKDLKGSNNDIKPYLILCNSQHDLSITLKEFYTRVQKTYETYGERARMAEENEGIDWKALSHAVRAIRQMKELLETGQIQYPLKDAEELKRIKEGKYTWNEVEKKILDGVDEVDELMGKSPDFHLYNNEFVEAFICSMY